ncbi:proton-coupled zinc antiporter SLC30A2-like [Engraulis encrasicolus]|uniref:proton-coupled zinc antiporter SLC30A2-like n=1 Tax=Engraulis encrasicolus TaxID=184585 RepID=UPI002FCEBF8F
MSLTRPLLGEELNLKAIPLDSLREEYLHTGVQEENRDGLLQPLGPTRTPFHCHQDTTTWAEDREKQLAKRKLIVTSVVCLVFMIGEVIGGYAAHSLAIMTDAAHLLTDFTSILVSLFSLCISSRPPSKAMTFGWHRSEILGALLSALSIWAVTAVLVFIAIQRILNDDYEIHTGIMIITSGCAVGVNILMALILHQSGSSHGHSHSGLSHGHSHGSCSSQATGNHGNASVRAAFIHVLGDLLQSLGVFLAALIINCWPEYKIADPICTFLFSVFVLATTITILRDIVSILMEGAPKGYDFDSVKDALLTVSSVQAVHDLHIWALTPSHRLLSVHLAIEDVANAQQVLMESTEMLQSKHGFRRVTIQIELHSTAMAFCSQCLEPMD